MGPTRVNGASEQLWRLTGVMWEGAQAHCIAGVSVTKGKLYKSKNRMVYVGTEWADSSSPPNWNSDCPQSPHGWGALDYVSSEIFSTIKFDKHCTSLFFFVSYTHHLTTTNYQNISFTTMSITSQALISHLHKQIQMLPAHPVEPSNYKT